MSRWDIRHGDPRLPIGEDREVFGTVRQYERVSEERRSSVAAGAARIPNIVARFYDEDSALERASNARTAG